MYCYRCDEEFAPGARFCRSCGAALDERSAEQLNADLGRTRYLLEELAKWERLGRVPAGLAADLALPYQKRAGHLEAALAATEAAAPTQQAAAAVVPAAEPAAVAATAAEPTPELSTADAPAESPVLETSVLPTAARESERSEAADAPALAAAELGSALMAAAVAEPVESAESPRDAEQELIERESPWSSVWKPFLYENIGWFVGAFLLLSGSFYFVAESQGLARTLLVTGLLGLYATGFWFGGRHLAGRGLRMAGRVLASISAALAPLVVLAAAPLKGESLALWAAVAVAAVLGMGALVRACAAVFEESRSGRLALAATGLLGLFALVPLAPATWALALFDAAGLVVLWALAPALRDLRRDPGRAAFAGIGLGYLGVALLIRAHVQGLGLGAPLGLAHYGPLLAFLVALVLRAEGALFERREAPSWLALLAYALLAPAALASLSHRLSFALACAIGALLLGRGAARYRSAVFTFIALFAGWVAFHAATGFFRAEWIFALVGGVKRLAGYGTGKLPWNYGGLASLIYLAVVAAIYAKARTARAEWALGAVRAFALGLSAVLLGWAQVGEDVRPALLTAGVITVGSLICSLRFEHPRLAYLTAASGLLFAIDVALAWRLDFAHAAGGAAVGALALVVAGLLSEPRRARCFQELALLGALVSVCLVLPSGTQLPAVIASTLAGAACLAVAFAGRSAFFAYPGLACGVWALTLGLDRVAGLSSEQLSWVLMLVGIGMLLASGFEKRARAEGIQSLLDLPWPARGADVLREPLRHVGRLCTWIAVVASFEGDAPALLLVAFAVASVLLARRQAQARHLHAATLAIAIAVFIESAELSKRGIPIALASTGLSFSLLALLLSRSERLSLRALRLSSQRASLPFVVHAALLGAAAVLAAVAIDGHRDQRALPVALVSASLLTIARCRRSYRWIYVASAAATFAAASLVPVSGLMLLFVLAGHLWLGLAVFSLRTPAISARAFGIEGLGPHFALLAHLHSVAVLLAAIWSAGHGSEAAEFALPAALIALLYLFATRVERRPVWLSVSAVAATFSLALSVPAAGLPLAVALAAVAIAGAAALSHRFEQQTRQLFALEAAGAALVAPVLATTGMAVATCAVPLWLLGSADLVPIAVIVGLGAATAVLAFLATGRRAVLPVAATAFVAALVLIPDRLDAAFLAGLAGVNLLLWLCGPELLSRLDRILAFVERHGLRVRADEGQGLSSSARHALVVTAEAGVGLALLFLATLALARWAAFALGLEPASAVAMVLAQAATCWHLLRRRPGDIGWHLALLTVGAGVWLLGGREGLPYAASAVALVLAVLEAASERTDGGGLLERLKVAAGRFERAQAANLIGAYGIAYSVVSLLGTEGDPASLATPVALALVALASAVRAAGGSRFSRTALLVLVPLSLHYALFYAGIRLSTGQPRETILPFLALAMSLAALAGEQFGRILKTGQGARSASVAAHCYALLAAAEWCAGLLLVGWGGGELLVSSLAVLGLTVFYLRRAQATGSQAFGYAGFAALIALYVSLRLQTDWTGPMGRRSDADALAGLLFGFAFLGVHTALRRLGVASLAEPARRMALIVPVLSTLLLEPTATVTNALLLFGLAMQLAALSAVEGRGALSGTLAAIAFNLALATVWLQAGRREAGDAQFYAIPAGATLVLLSYVFRGDLDARWQTRLRTVGILGIYVSSAWPALTSFGTPSHVLWCVLLCVIGVAVGIALRVRVYLYVGTAFLVTTIVGNMVRFGLREHAAGAAFLTLLGLLIVGFMIFFTARREELLRRYRKIEQMLAEWQ